MAVYVSEWACTCVSGCLWRTEALCGGQRHRSDPQNWSCGQWWATWQVLGTELQRSAEAAGAPNARATPSDNRWALNVKLTLRSWYWLRNGCAIFNFSLKKNKHINIFRFLKWSFPLEKGAEVSFSINALLGPCWCSPQRGTWQTRSPFKILGKDWCYFIFKSWAEFAKTSFSPDFICGDFACK